jgi:hypothetical protein
VEGFGVSDWIDRYIQITDGIGSPEIFRLWAAISAVGGAMERRLWARTSMGILYPNMYIMLVAPPGVGKTQAISPVEDIWHRQGNLSVAPDSMTKAALVDTLVDSRRVVILPEGAGIMEYHSLQISVSELGVLVNAHDLEFLSVINRIFDNSKVFRERRRHVKGGQEIQIVAPQLNILAGTQPGFLASVLPEEAWLMGTTSRFIMVFAAETPSCDLFAEYIEREPAYAELSAWMLPWTEMHGQFRWDNDAVGEMQRIHKNGLNNFTPVPDHPKLEHYRPRRTQFLIRLAMISAMSRTSNTVIEQFDVERARHWLLSAEATMPAIFKAMSTKSDAQLIDELHTLCWREYKAGKNAAMPTKFLVNFLHERVYSERIPKIIETMNKAGLITDLGGDMFRPNPRLDLGQGAVRDGT